MDKSIGRGRFEAGIQTMEWALPFSIVFGRGAYVFNFLCFEFLYWRHGNRYTPMDQY